MPASTISCFSNFIVMENFFCINRSFLLDCPRKKFTANVIFTVTLTLLITAVISDILLSDVSLSTIIFQGFLAVEFFDLIITARVKSKSFEALKRLDEKCGIEDIYIQKLIANSTKHTIFVAICAVIDVASSIILGTSISKAIIFIIFFSAQDAELIFFSVVVDAINLRLSKLEHVSPVFGSKVYRHLLITTAAMNEEVSPRIIILLSVVLGTTVTYFTVMMLPLNMEMNIICYLVWRELKVFCCLWRVCYASSRSDSICQQLAFQLAKKLALDPAINKVKNLQGHCVLRRWFSALLSERPQFLSGSVLSIGLAVPLHLLDLSVNYVLIIVQIYIAYN